MRMRRARIVLALAAVLAGCDVKIQRADMPEPPPPGWAELGINPLYHVERMPADQIAEACRAAGVTAGDRYGPHSFPACVDPVNHRVILALQGERPADLDLAQQAHEFPHTWGLRHRNGKDWFQPDGTPAGPLSPERRQMMLAMALGQVQQAQAAQPGRGLLALGRSQAAAEATR